MLRPAQHRSAFVIDAHGCGVHRSGIFRLGKDKIVQAGNFDIPGDACGLLLHELGQIAENLRFFPGFLALQQFQFPLQGRDFVRFDKHRLPAGRLVQHPPLDLPVKLLFDRYDIAASPHADDALL
ncbi:hypothetical protein D1872_236910 [compost metagenome]